MCTSVRLLLPLNLQKNITVYLRYCAEQKTLSTKTTKAYKIDLTQYAAFSKGKLARSSLSSYISYLHKQFKPKTAKRKIASLKAFTHFLMIQDIIGVNPFDKNDVSFREPIVPPKTIPFNIIEKILTNAYERLQQCSSDYSQRSAVRDIAVLEVLFATGARVSEICTLTPDTVDLANHTLKILGKGSKERIIQIENSEVLNALNKYYEAFYEDILAAGFFFINKLHNRLTKQSVREMINKHVNLIGYEKHITSHMFQHRNHTKTRLSQRALLKQISPCKNYRSNALWVAAVLLYLSPV